MAKKRSFRGKPKKSKSGGGGRNPADMMAQFQKMQSEMARAQEELANESMTITVGGGAVAIDITGHQRILGVKIDPELLDPEEVELLQDLITAGMNQAIEKSQEKSAERMEGLTGGLGVQDLLGGLGGM